MNIAPSPRNIICAFYASTTYGSEYRAGLEFIRFAAAHGFDLAIIADLEENSSAEALEAEIPGIRVIRIPSPMKRQTTLYRFQDFFAQTIWHLRVARWIRRHNGNLFNLWVQNGALPWLPLTPYFGVSEKLIWGPVGGGEPPTPSMMRRLKLFHRTREQLRSLIEGRMLRAKCRAVRQTLSLDIVPLARTSESKAQLEKYFGLSIPLVPEILEPISAASLQKEICQTPKFIWVGQDVPRKNLGLALEIFASLQREHFPQATLDIYGCTSRSQRRIPGTTFHGWVSNIDWEAFRHAGVLLLTSYREGLPSVILEAVRNGLFCVAADTGSISGLGANTVMTLPKDEYPEFSRVTLAKVAQRIRMHLHETSINILPVSQKHLLITHLTNKGVIQ